MIDRLWQFNETSMFKGSVFPDIRCWRHRIREGCCLYDLFWVPLLETEHRLLTGLWSDPARHILCFKQAENHRPLVLLLSHQAQPIPWHRLLWKCRVGRRKRGQPRLAAGLPSQRMFLSVQGSCFTLFVNTAEGSLWPPQAPELSWWMLAPYSQRGRQITSPSKLASGTLCWQAPCLPSYWKIVCIALWFKG